MRIDLKQDNWLQNAIVNLTFWQATMIDFMLRQMQRQDPGGFLEHAKPVLVDGMPWRWLDYKNVEEYLLTLKIADETAREYAALLQPLIEESKQKGTFENGFPWKTNE